MSKTVSAKTTAKSKKTSKKINPMQRLFRLHTAGVVLYLLAAIAALVFMKATTFQLSIGFLAKNVLASNGNATVLAPASRAIFDVELRWIVAIIMIISAVIPALYLTKFKKKYTNAVEGGINVWRWVDLGITLALVTETVALLSAVSDIAVLKVIAGLVLMAAALSWLAERKFVLYKKPAWKSYALGLITAALPWVIIFAYAVATPIYGMVAAPWSVYVLYITTFGAAVLLALNQRNEYRQNGSWKYTPYAERNYVALGMFAKLAFALTLIIAFVK